MLEVDGARKGTVEISDLERELLKHFAAKPRRIPKRPTCSPTSTVIIRRDLLPFYYAIFDHHLGSFTELRYRTSKAGPLLSVRIPPETQPIARLL